MKITVAASTPTVGQVVPATGAFGVLGGLEEGDGSDVTIDVD